MRPTRARVERVFARLDVLDACARRDLGRIIMVLGAQGLTQGRVSELTGITQGRLSEWASRKLKPRASSTFEAYADGLGCRRRHVRRWGWPSTELPDPARASRLPPGTRPGPCPVRRGPPVESLADLLGRETVGAQLGEVIAVLDAEQGRRAEGSAVRRPGGRISCSPAAPAPASPGRAGCRPGLPEAGGPGDRARLRGRGRGPRGLRPWETGKLLAEAVRPASGGILLVNTAHDWQRLPSCGQHVLRRLYEQLTEYRSERRDELAVILVGQAGPLRSLLAASPSLAARFRAVIDFPRYTPAQIAVIFADLVEEAGLTPAPAAQSKAAKVLARAEGDRGPGSARLAVRLLNQAVKP